MAESWQIVLWVVVAVAVVILIVVAIVICLVCRKRNRRKKHMKHQYFEWEKKDETDYGKRRVHYNTASGSVKFLDETDSGAKSSNVTRVAYNAKTEEAKIHGVEDKRAVTDTNGKHVNDETPPRVLKFNEYQFSSELSGAKSNHTRQESKSLSETHPSKDGDIQLSVDEHQGDYVRLQTAAVQRVRLQPQEMASRATHMTSAMTSSNNLTLNNVKSRNAMSKVTKNTVKSYTNHGYSQAGQNVDLMSNVQFQQPVAVVKAFVHPRRNSAVRQARYLPRNHAKMYHKKSLKTSTISRRKPLLYTWSLGTDRSKCTQPWLNVPLTYREIPAHSRRNTKVRSSKRSKRGLVTRKDQNFNSLDGIFIRDSPPRPSKQNTKRLTHYEKQARPIEGLPANVSTSNVSYNLSNTGEMSEKDSRSYGDFYAERYRVVKKSEFPAFQQSMGTHEPTTSHAIDPEISSIISGSEFSDFLPNPPQPSDNLSDGSSEGYSHGSYKAYKSRLDMSSKGRREVMSEHTSQKVREKHAKSFQETLDTLKNGDKTEQYRRAQHEVRSSEDAGSPWVSNDINFRKKHGVPITGVPVLPPDPVFIRMQDSDESEANSRGMSHTE